MYEYDFKEHLIPIISEIPRYTTFRDEWRESMIKFDSYYEIVFDIMDSILQNSSSFYDGKITILEYTTRYSRKYCDRVLHSALVYTNRNIPGFEHEAELCRYILQYSHQRSNY